MRHLKIIDIDIDCDIDIQGNDLQGILVHAQQYESMHDVP